MLINTMLCNSEAWHGITFEQVKAFEKIDEALIKGLVEGHSKIPIPALYLEKGQTPIRYIIACRRILYLQTILHRSEEELIFKVYAAQNNDPIKGDFCQLVNEDRNLIDLQLATISNMTRYDLKVLVKSKARNAAFKYLISIKESKSKMDPIIYLNSFKILPYMESMTREQSSLLLALRTRTCRGIRTDFGDLYLDKQCPLPGCPDADSLPHLLTCRVLQVAVQDPSLVQYGDVFSMDTNMQQLAVERFTLLIEARDKILERSI